MMSEINSHIAVVSNLEQFQAALAQTYAPSQIKFFFKDDFLVDDAKAVIKEAYVAEASQKIIALGAKSYNLYAQNALLKILEEPPRNIAFIVAVPSKTALLSTIRSRLPIKIHTMDSEKVVSGLTFRTLDLQDIYDFVQDRKFMDKRELKGLVQAITTEALSQGLRFSEEELTLFQKLLQLAELNSRAHNILTTQLLTILNRRYR